MYYSLIQKQKMVELKLDAIVISQGCAHGFGNLKQNDFDKFLNTLDPKKQEQENISDTLQHMKDMDLPVEEN